MNFNEDLVRFELVRVVAGPAFIMTLIVCSRAVHVQHQKDDLLLHPGYVAVEGRQTACPDSITLSTQIRALETSGTN